MIYTDKQIINVIEDFEYFNNYKYLNGVNVIVEDFYEDESQVIWATVTVDYTQDGYKETFDECKYTLETLKKYIKPLSKRYKLTDNMTNKVYDIGEFDTKEEAIDYALRKVNYSVDEVNGDEVFEDE